MVINISIHNSVKKLLCYNVFNKVMSILLTFMRTVLTDKKFTSGNDHRLKSK